MKNSWDDSFEYESSSVFVMTRSTPPGTMPVKMKLGFSTFIVSFVFISLFIVNYTICKLQGRFFVDVISISEASTGGFNNQLTSIIFPMNSFFFSLISTVVVSYMNMFTSAPKFVIKMCRFFNVFITFLIIVSGTLTYADSPKIHDIFTYIAYASIFVYSTILIACFIAVAPKLLSAFRIILFVISAVGVFLMIMSKPIGHFSGRSVKSIGEYVCVGGFLLILVTFYKEISDVNIDVVVVQEENKPQE